MNPVDYKLPKAIGGLIPGFDVCGTITKVGASAASDNKNKFQVGDVVLGAAKGSMAEFCLADAGKIAKLPVDWTVEEGAALPVAYNTALTGFEKAGVLQRYKENNNNNNNNNNAPTPPLNSILVIGASGGCGCAALQLAKGMGIPRIIGICSSKNVEFCKENGATEIVPYDDDDKDAMEQFLTDNAGKMDLIYDSASGSGGGEIYSSDPKILSLLKQQIPKPTKDNNKNKNDDDPNNNFNKPTYLVLNGGLSQWVRTFAFGSPSSDPRICMVLTEHSNESLSLAMQLLNKAKLKPVLDSTVEFTEEAVEEGYNKLKSRRAKGKIVVKISSPPLQREDK